MRFDRRLKPQVNVDLTPLIDVVLQLIIFFMITSTFKTAPGIELELPDSSSAKTVALTELYITAVSDNEVYVNKTLTSVEGLDKVLKDQILGMDLTDLSVVVEGDKAAPYQLMISILDVLRKNGLEAINLVTQNPGVEKPRGK